MPASDPGPRSLPGADGLRVRGGRAPAPIVVRATAVVGAHLVPKPSTGELGETSGLQVGCRASQL